ncbi:hypothetical protein ACE939_00800 [Aquimarina sp. W85]|uniref:hypothetical protein n=1 Tax=Aquimarina rhodophyticola TaxID=3342246 RepID=UPI00366B89E0
MVLQKNSTLIVNICQVYIRSTHGNAFPVLTEAQTSPSKIKFTSDSSTSEVGVLYKNKLQLSYKGLSDSHFNDLHKIVTGLYEVYIRTEDGEYLQLSSTRSPMEVKSKFSSKDTSLTFENEDFLPILQMSQQKVNDLGFAYTLSFSLS